MKFVEVEGLPDMKAKGPHDRNKLKNLLKEFLNADIKTAKVVLYEGEYSSTYTARIALYNACARHKYPIWITVVNDEIYLIRKDI